MSDLVKNVLVIEDDEVVARLISRFCALEFGTKILIDWVSNSDQGLRRLNNPIYKYDLVITDWNCPNENGGMVVVRGVNKLNIPIIVYTGDIMNKKITEAIKLGAILVDKASEISNLIQWVRNALSL